MSTVSEAFRLLLEESMLPRAEIRMSVSRKTLRRKRPRVTWMTIASGDILELEERFRSISSAFGKEPARVRGQYRIWMTHPGPGYWDEVAFYVKVTQPAAKTG